MMAARAVLAFTLLASALAEDTFSFVGFFEGEWDMDKTLVDGTVVRTEYIMSRDQLGLSGRYVEGDSTMNIAVKPDAVNPSKGRFTKLDDTDTTEATIFSYDFSQHPPSHGVRISNVRASARALPRAGLGPRAHDCMRSRYAPLLRRMLISLISRRFLRSRRRPRFC